MLTSIKTFKRYCKATLNVFFKKKKFATDKKFIYMIKFLCQIEFYCLKFKNC